MNVTEDVDYINNALLDAKSPREWLSIPYARVKSFREAIQHLQSENEQLNKQLEGAIVPKFKIGQEVWYFFEQELRTDFIKKYHINTGTMIRYNLSNGYFGNIYKERDLFATEAEALASLKKSEEK